MLGSACGKCERCDEEQGRQQLAAMIESPEANKPPAPEQKHFEILAWATKIYSMSPPELGVAFAEISTILRAQQAATHTLERAGYTYHGGELWKPPVGPSASPLLDTID